MTSKPTTKPDESRKPSTGQPSARPFRKPPVDLKKWGDEIVDKMVKNLNYNVVNDGFEWTGWRRLPAIVSAATVNKIEQRLNVRAWLIADRWAFQKPQEVRAMEADGSLLEKLGKQEWLETEQGIDPKTGVGSENEFWLDLPRVVKAETVRMIEQNLSLRGWQIADRWALGSPKKVKRMEAAGTLIPRLKEQQKLEAGIISDARVAGRMSDTPDSEILAMHEIPLLPSDGDGGDKPESDE